MAGLFVKKGDTVKVLSGREKGKTGKVLRVYPSEKRVVIEHVNFHKKHQRPTKDNPKGGVLEVEGKVDIAKVMLVCKHCEKPTRVGHRFLTDGRKIRFCRKCKEDIDS